VVGVVGNSKDVQGFSQSIIFSPLTSRNFARPSTGGVTILVRTDAGTDALNDIQNEIAFSDPNLNVFHVQTRETYLNRSRSALRFSIQLMAELECLACCWPPSGSPGLRAAQRRKEIAIRTALGASKAQALGAARRHRSGSRRHGAGILGRDGTGKNGLGVSEYAC
jgi:hypothetical protein